MTDIFQEVEEEVRRERFEKLWKQYGDYVIAGFAVVVIAVAGFELWKRYDDNRHALASAQYEAATQLAASNPNAAIQQLEALSQSAPGGYATLARFAEADTLLATGERDKALAIYRSIGGSGDDPIGGAARLRAAWSIADFAPRSTLENLVQPLDRADSPWRFLAREVLAYADYRIGDLARAGREYETLANQPEAPATLKSRARGMAALIKGGGERNFGVVPQATSPQPNQATPNP